MGKLVLKSKHRLLCGDCRDPAAWERLLGGERVNVCFTSPPYASQRKYDESSGFKPIKPDEYVAWWEPLQANVRKHLAGDGSFFVNIKLHCEDGERVLYVFDLVLAMCRKHGWHLIDEMCWKRNSIPGLTAGRFKNFFEPIYHFAGGNGSSIKCDQYAVAKAGEGFVYKPGLVKRLSKDGSNENSVELELQDVVLPSNVLEFDADSSKEQTGHTAPFPVGLPSFFIRAFSDPGDIIADPFMGSFSTGMAAEANNRRAVGMEISAAYVDVCLRRYLARYPDADPVRHDGTKWSEVTE